MEVKIFNALVGLIVKPDYTLTVDLIGGNDDSEGPLSWNISTPEELQYIPTEEVLELFRDWRDFLKVQESVKIK